MTNRERHLFHVTRQRSWLISRSLALVVLLGLSGLVLAWFHEPTMKKSLHAVEELFKDPRIRPVGPDSPPLAKPAKKVASFDDWIEEVRDLAATDVPEAGEYEDLQKNLAAAEGLEQPRRDLLRDYARGMAGPAAEREAARTALANAPAQPRLRELRADVLARDGRAAEALALYEEEGGAEPSADFSREQAFELALSLKDLAALRRMLDDPRFSKAADGRQQMEAQYLLGDVSGMLGRFFGHMIRSLRSPSRMIVTLTCGLIWFMIVALVGGAPRKPLFWILPAGFILGALSTLPVLVSGVWFERAFGLQLTGVAPRDIAFYVVSVGLREEFWKLLFCLPLLFVLKRRDSDALFLVAASAVGLGFAIEENISYYAPGGLSGWGRFVTANFLHLALTGAAGFALSRFLRWPLRCWDEAAGTLLMAVLLHGLYDATTINVGHESFGFLGIILLAAISLRYFHQLRMVREVRRALISPMAVFLLGSALLLGLMWNASVWSLGLKMAFKLFVPEALGMAPLIFIFIKEFRTE